MARVQGGGPGKYAWPLVIFGAGFVIFLLVAIVLYTQLSGAQNRIAELEEQQENVYSSADLNDPVAETYDQNLGSGETILGQMLQDMGRLKELAGFDAENTLQQIQNRLSERNIESALMSTVRQLRTDLESANDEIQQLEQQLAEARQQQQQLQEEKAQLAKKFKQGRQQMQQQLDQRAGQVDDLQEKLSQMEQQLSQQMDQARQDLRDQIAELEEENEQLTQEKEELQGRIQDLLEEPGAGSQRANVAEADGRIVSLISGQDKAYLNLGSKDGLMLGTTFEIFASDELVKLEGDRLPRGKATVEVLEVNEGSSIVRAVRRERGATLREGDAAVNLVYHPDQQLVFHVFGRFDVNGDGQATEEERRRIESMIRQWGGRVSNELSYEVDFLVLGQRTTMDGVSQDLSQAEQEAQQQARKKMLQQHQELAKQARDLSIPVLNQNRFLSLVGHYRR